MKNRFFHPVVLLVALVVNAFPLYQAFHNGGHLCYTNAYDESTYLQYDYSKATQKITRPGQYLVTFAHEMGLSGGWINFSFDLVSILCFLYLIKLIFKACGYADESCNLAAIFLFFTPFLFNGANPIVDKLFSHSLTDGYVRWFAIPEAFFLPLVRTPEPQFSILLLCLALLFSLKWGNKAPLFLVLPFLYPFISGPLAFVLFSVFLKEKIFKSPRQQPWAWIGSYLAICALVILSFKILHPAALAPEAFSARIMETRYPLLSFTFLAGLLSYIISSKWVPADKRFLIWTFLLTPLALDNCQILTGFIAEPTNLEQYAGVACASLVLVFAMIQAEFPFFLKAFIVVLALGCFARSSKVYLAENMAQEKLFRPDVETLEILRENSPFVAINDLGTAGIASMIFPRQPMTLFNYANACPELAPATFRNYLCAKEAISQDPAMKARFSETIKTMDFAYQYETNNFILVDQGRGKVYQVRHDPDVLPENCPKQDLKYLIVK